MPDITLPTTEITLTVPFHDVDPANVVWHGHYAKYLELVRCALLEEIEYSYTDMFESGFYWPIVDMRIKYIRPLKFEQDFRVVAAVKEWEYRLRIDYKIFDQHTDEKLTSAYTIQVAYDIKSDEMLYETPAIFRKKIGVLT